MKINLKHFKVKLIVFCISFTSFASAEEPLEVIMKAYRSVPNVETGAIEEVEADEAIPGDIIIYRATFTNKSKKPFSSLSPQIPIPGSLVYVKDSAKPLPVKVLLRDEQGIQAFPPVDTTTQELIQPEQYGAILWELDSLAPGESFEAELQAKVLKD